jgi:eukaryotic-like serine/threonine-protein kinase
MIGRTVGKYRIVAQLGRGGAGIVYRAVDESLHREVAIKTLNPDLANTEVMKRFGAEATILARLNHPQIATIYELFRSDTDHLMVMECVRGETLDKLCGRLGPMPAEHAAYLIDQLLSALEHAHRAGVVHRDMKPANVMVTESGGVKIMDFGIARVRGAEQMTQMTVDGRMMGTPAYMPPEQVLGQEVDGRADLYATGVVFYRLLTGVLPFIAETPLAMLQRQILETPMPLTLHRPDLPEWCDRVVARALAKSPSDRFQTAEEFRTALARATGPLPAAEISRALSATIDVSTSSGVVEATEQLAPLAAVEHTDTPGTRSSWKHAAIAAAGIASIVATVGYVTLRRPSSSNVVAAAAAPSPAPPPVHIAEPVAPVAAPSPEPPLVRAAVVERRSPPPAPRVEEASLVFETKAIVGTKKPREHEAQLVLADGRITVLPEGDAEYPLYSIPYGSVISISYSRGRDPMWNSPQGPAPVTRGGGTLGRLGIVVARDWIALRTSTEDQFIAMRFDDMLVRRVLLALEERTGRQPQLIAEPKESKN